MTIGILSNNFINDEYKNRISQAAERYSMSCIYDVKTEELPQCDILFGNLEPSLLKQATALKWFQCSFAGVESLTDLSLYSTRPILTNVAGAFGITISEHMIGEIIMMMRHLDDYIIYQKSGQWMRNLHSNVRSIYGSRITVIGLGDIGQNFARRAQMLGATITGVRKNLKPKPDYVDVQYTFEDIDKSLPNADVVALCVPSTKDTQHIMNEKRIGLLKNDAILVNVGRGSAIDQDALVNALNTGKIGGAILDVTSPEPLPSDHPLWSAKNCFITPHVSGNTSLIYTRELIVKIFLENLSLFAEGKPLLHVVDMTAGY